MPPPSPTEYTVRACCVTAAREAPSALGGKLQLIEVKVVEPAVWCLGKDRGT